MRSSLLCVPPLFAMALFSANAQSVDQTWRTTCTICHGAKAQGGGAGTRTMHSDERRDPRLDREFFEAIKNGKKDAGMPAFGRVLSDEQAWGMVVYIREMQQQEWRDKNGDPKAVDGVYTSQHHKYRIENVVESGLDTPWALDFLPDGRLIVTERPGGVRLIDKGTLSPPLQGTHAVRNKGQGGMMDVAVHPDYKNNGWIYLAFSDPRPGDTAKDELGMTRIVRGKIKGGDWVDEETIFQANEKHYLPSDIHFGCRLVFSGPAEGNKRYLYFGIGERGYGDLAQDRTRPNGKIYRVWDDGSIPPDNPFVGEKDAYEAIWSYGHRNPQGLTLDLGGTLWETEHGPRGGDEVNRIEKGRNYGWPTVSYGINYSGEPYKTPWPAPEQNFVMPVFRWLPSIGSCGLTVAAGPAFAKWTGDLLAGGLSGANVDRLRIKDGVVTEREELVHGMGRVRDVVCAPDGTIYIVLNDPHKIVHMVPAD